MPASTRPSLPPGPGDRRTNRSPARDGLSAFTLVIALLLAFTLAACGTDAGATDAPGTASSLPLSAPTPRPSLRTPEPGASWPPAWSDAICKAWVQLHRPDAAGGGAASSDAASRAIEVLKRAGAWPPGAALRSAIARDGFTLLDASSRGGQTLVDRAATLRAAEDAYVALNAATGFSCPEA